MKRTMLAATIGLLAVSPVQAQDVSYAGKTVTLLINFSAGGSTDILGRALAPAIAAHIPGKPTLVVRNMPGAGGLVATNYFYNKAKPDGMTIGFLTAVAMAGLVETPRVRYEPSKFHWLAALPQTQVIVANKSLGIAKPADFANRNKALVHGTTRLNSSSAVLSGLFYRMAGIGHRFVAGYRGQAGTLLALQRGEVEITDMGITIVLAKPKLMSGPKFSAVLQRGVLGDDGKFARHRLLPNIPTIPEALQAIKPAALKSDAFKAYRVAVATFNTQFGLLLPPGTDQKIVATLRKAVVAALKSDQAKEAAKKAASFDYDYIDGPAAEKVIADLRAELAAAPKVKAMLQAIMAPKKKKKK